MLVAMLERLVTKLEKQLQEAERRNLPTADIRSALASAKRDLADAQAEDCLARAM